MINFAKVDLPFPERPTIPIILSLITILLLKLFNTFENPFLYLKDTFSNVILLKSNGIEL